MPGPLEDSLSRWQDAGLIDDATATRIRAFENASTPSSRLRLPVILALVFGAMLLGAGVLLFVAAHWDDLSPASRFALVVAMVAVFHVSRHGDSSARHRDHRTRRGNLPERPNLQLE
jgi:uncharacterized membrane protein